MDAAALSFPRTDSSVEEDCAIGVISSAFIVGAKCWCGWPSATCRKEVGLPAVANPSCKIFALRPVVVDSVNPVLALR